VPLAAARLLFLPDAGPLHVIGARPLSCQLLFCCAQLLCASDQCAMLRGCGAPAHCPWVGLLQCNSTASCWAVWAASPLAMPGRLKHPPAHHQQAQHHNKAHMGNALVLTYSILLAPLPWYARVKRRPALVASVQCACLVTTCGICFVLAHAACLQDTCVLA
jgi:hypothetical protein